MTETSNIGLVRLEDSDLVLANPADDLRGLTVVDRYHHRVGDVEALIIDEGERRARLLVVASGGIMGLGRVRRLVPVEAVTRVDDEVHVETAHDRVHGSAPYEPALTSAETYDETYGHYGYLPFWASGYVHPYLHRRL